MFDIITDTMHPNNGVRYFLNYSFIIFIHLLGYIFIISAVFLQCQKRIVKYYIKKVCQRISAMEKCFKRIGILIHVLSWRQQKHHDQKKPYKNQTVEDDIFAQHTLATVFKSALQQNPDYNQTPTSKNCLKLNTILNWIWEVW